MKKDVLVGSSNVDEIELHNIANYSISTIMIIGICCSSRPAVCRRAFAVHRLRIKSKEIWARRFNRTAELLRKGSPENWKTDKQRERRQRARKKTMPPPQKQQQQLQ